MALNLLKLASQGRAFDASRTYTEEELEGLLALERERGLDRMVAAEYIRNGIVTVGEYDLAKEAGVVPKSLEEIKTEAVVKHVKSLRKNLGLKPLLTTKEEEDSKEPEKKVSKKRVISKDKKK